jgi:hypothetical protein
MLTTEKNFAALEKSISECEKQIHLRYTLIKDKSSHGNDTSHLVYEIKDLESTMKSYQVELKKHYERVFPETKNAPADFWDEFLSL